MCAERLDDQAFKALGHRDRRAILSVLADGERPVGSLVDATDLDQPVVSQHLKVLRTAGLVSVRGDGNRRLYSVDFARVADIRRFLDQFWNDKLGALKRVAEEGTA
ncbi:MAG: ArsR/SmtB family transcription factor [Ilumatobacter sp.]